ncbi:MAG TPA: hypothetical protein VD999_02195 [Vitreimonas sp.]|nr:hypothetical protein [Vitreimonas sp.]
MKKSFVLGLMVMSSLVFSACTGTKSDSTSPTVPSEAAQKSGDTIITGKITQVGTQYFIQATGQQPEDIDSYGVDLSQYVGQTVTITGQYSGETLFVGKIE